MHTILQMPVSSYRRDGKLTHPAGTQELWRIRRNRGDQCNYFPKRSLMAGAHWQRDGGRIAPDPFGDFVQLKIGSTAIDACEEKHLNQSKIAADMYGNDAINNEASLFADLPTNTFLRRLTAL